MPSTGAYTVLVLRHLAAQREVILPVRINNFLMDTKPSWSSSEVYGRMDPIFTYQNTKRTFQMTCQTVHHDELGSVVAPTLPGATNPVQELIDTYKEAGSRLTYAEFLRTQISKIYKFMYPVYQDTRIKIGDTLDVRMSQLRAPPLLKILVPNVFAGAGVSKPDDSEIGDPGNPQSEAYIFVPEAWSLSTGLADASKNQMTLTTPGDLKFLAPQGSYGFTIGGTILHQEAPGWRWGERKIVFTEGATDAEGTPIEPGEAAYGWENADRSVFKPAGFPFGVVGDEEGPDETTVIALLEGNT